METPTATCAARLVRNHVDDTLGVGFRVVDRGRNDMACDRQRQHRRFECTGGAEAVAYHRLERCHRHPRGAVAKDGMKSAGFRAIVLRCRGAMSIDVIDASHIDLGIGERRSHHGRDRTAFGLWRRGWKASQLAL